MHPFGALVSGLLFSLSLIVAIGAQNAYVLRQGALRAHVGTVVTICATSDVVLIATGVAGVGVLVSTHPDALAVVRVAGAALLLAYAALAARRVLTAGASRGWERPGGGSRRAAAAATLGFTWLNPAVYLDTIVILGSVAGAHPATRWWFAVGAATASVGWFIALGYGARLLTPLLAHRHAPRALDGFVAVVMVLTALRTF